jgi:alpha-L-fucosidase 2
MRLCVTFLALACTAALHAAPVDQKDVAYTRPAGHPVLLDLHVPDGPGPFPAAILIHGGGFDQGSKSTNVKPLFDVLANAGFAWLSIVKT